MTTQPVVGAIPPRVDLTLYQGDDFFLDVVFTGTGGLDLTGYTPKAEIRSVPGDPSLIASFVASVTGPTTIRLHLTHASAEAVGSDCSWDCQVTDPNGVVTTVVYGSVTLVRQVTR